MFREQNADQPENHQDQWQETQKKKNTGFAQQCGEYMCTGQKYGRCRNEQREAHAPEVACNAM
jgi:hypothetical protein